MELSCYEKNSESSLFWNRKWIQGINYIKNNRVYFVYQKLTATEHIIWTDNSKVLAIYKLRYYFDSNGKIVRYVDEKGNIHENDSQMREEDEEIRRFKLNFLGNRL